MAPKVMIPFLVSMMLLTGVGNTIFMKYQDMQCVRNCDSKDPRQRKNFEQPVLQTVQMFVGEMLCWLVLASRSFYVYYTAIRKRRQSGYSPIAGADDHLHTLETADGHAAASAIKPLVPNDETRTPLRGGRLILLSLPACCDITGTTLMNVGLFLVTASIYQMIRGCSVLFVGFFSVIFLGRRLRLYQWSALVCVVIGVGIVGLAGALFKDHKAVSASSATQVHASVMMLARQVHATARSPELVRAVIGILLIALAQIFVAGQFVLEEWILENYALEPIKVVAWEGTFGFLFSMLGMIILHLAIGRTESGRYGYFDAKEGWRQYTHNRIVGITAVLTMFTIAGFNYFGLSVTRSVSATSRATIDTCRTLFIWIVSLGLGWESFKWLQVLGFALLVYGTFLFNDIIRPPLKSWARSASRRWEPLLPEEPIDHI
ncbi:MAG: hypothetical protein M1816_002964 [Peltula sp. TS41687]|nr:MAG: hypothetical protein M1816_002964 [Peltula sp. TS41687]